MSLEEIFKSADEKEQKTALSKEDWRAKKSEERKDIYTLADSAAETVSSNGDLFKAYLSVQSRFDRYSITNALLIWAQKENATKLKDFESWKKDGVFVKSGEKGISILEPGEEYTRKDGTVATTYNVKKVFDISQTNAEQKPEPKVSTDERLLLKALIQNCDIQIQTVDTIKNNMGAYFDSTENKIYVCRGLSLNEAFCNIAKEIAHAKFAKANGEHYFRKSFEIPAASASFILCKKYGVNTEHFSFEKVTQYFEGNTPKSIREKLAEIKETSGNMSKQMHRFFEQQRKEKEAER